MPEPQSGQIAWSTPFGTIRKGMKVLEPDGTCIGIVDTLEGEELGLTSGEAGAEGNFIALTQIDGVGPEGVLLSGRGDATFGLGAEP